MERIQTVPATGNTQSFIRSYKSITLGHTKHIVELWLSKYYCYYVFDLRLVTGRSRLESQDR